MGLGNNTSDFDFDCSSIDALDNPAIVTGDEEDVNEKGDGSSDKDGPKLTASDESDCDEVPMNSAESEPVEVKSEDAKNMMVERKATSGKKTAPHASTSEPRKPSKKVEKAKQKFAEVSLKEEETMQKSLEVRKVKLQSQAQTDITKTKAKAQIKINHDNKRHELHMEHLRLEMEFGHKREMERM